MGLTWDIAALETTRLVANNSQDVVDTLHFVLALIQTSIPLVDSVFVSSLKGITSPTDEPLINCDTNSLTITDTAQKPYQMALFASRTNDEPESIFTRLGKEKMGELWETALSCRHLALARTT